MNEATRQRSGADGTRGPLVPHAPTRRARALALVITTAAAGCVTVPGASAPPALPPGVRALVQERPYDVRGVTHEDITRSLGREARRATGGSWRGLHRWHIRWEFRTRPVGRACGVTSATVHLESVVTVPRWVDRAAADSALIRDWDAYIGALRTHENGHRDLAHRAAGEIQRALRRVTASSCPAASVEANRVARDILDRYRRRNREYDEKTDRGATQGAAWPPGRSGALSGG